MCKFFKFSIRLKNWCRKLLTKSATVLQFNRILHKSTNVLFTFSILLKNPHNPKVIIRLKKR